MSRTPRPASSSDHAVRDAHEVVGMYGDPDTSWGICAELTLTRDVGDLGDLDGRLEQLCERHRHLGTPPTVVRAEPQGWTALRSDLASRPYTSTDPLLRLAVDSSSQRLLVAAHHGAIDGLALLAVAGAALGTEISSAARGIGRRPPAHGFVMSSARRVAEAMLTPPPRFPGRGEPGALGEDLGSRLVPRSRHGSVRLAAAVLAAFAGLPDAKVTRPIVIIVGASRREPGPPAADRETAYLRLRLPPRATEDEIRERLRLTDPEPDFPETSARGAGPLAVRLLRGRLGATATLSNLGVVAGDGIGSVAMFPATSGPRAVAVGLASTETTTTVSLRTRRRDFTAQEHEGLLDQLCRGFSEDDS